MGLERRYEIDTLVENPTNHKDARDVEPRQIPLSPKMSCPACYAGCHPYFDGGQHYSSHCLVAFILGEKVLLDDILMDVAEMKIATTIWVGIQGEYTQVLVIDLGRYEQGSFLGSKEKVPQNAFILGTWTNAQEREIAPHGT